MTETIAKPSRAPMVFTVLVLAVVMAFFAIAFVIASTQNTQGTEEALTAETYMDVVRPLLARGNAARGEELIYKTYECYACHIIGSGAGAPSLEGIGERAKTERPPLTAEAYLYEAIMYPTAYVVEGYAASMPANYPQRLSDQELADMIVYLLEH